MPTKDEVKKLEDKLQIVINRLIYLQNLVDDINISNQISEAEFNKISIASIDVCEAYIEVLRALGLSDHILKKLGFDTCDNIKKLEISPFLVSLNNLLISDIRDKQRAVLVNGANDVYELLNAGNTIRYAQPGKPKKLSGFELFCAFATAALINSGQTAALGYLINGMDGARIGAALGLIFTSTENYTELQNGELAQAKYALARTVKTFYDDVHAYKYAMHPKDLFNKENSLDISLENTFTTALCVPK